MGDDHLKRAAKAGHARSLGRNIGNPETWQLIAQAMEPHFRALHAEQAAGIVWGLTRFTEELRAVVTNNIRREMGAPQAAQEPLLRKPATVTVDPGELTPRRDQVMPPAIKD